MNENMNQDRNERDRLRNQPPSVSKTTLLRDVARIRAGHLDLDSRLTVIDTTDVCSGSGEGEEG